MDACVVGPLRFEPQKTSELLDKELEASARHFQRLHPSLCFLLTLILFRFTDFDMVVEAMFNVERRSVSKIFSRKFLRSTSPSARKVFAVEKSCLPRASTLSFDSNRPQSASAVLNRRIETKLCVCDMLVTSLAIMVQI